MRVKEFIPQGDSIEFSYSDNKAKKQDKRVVYDILRPVNEIIKEKLRKSKNNFEKGRINERRRNRKKISFRGKADSLIRKFYQNS